MNAELLAYWKRDLTTPDADLLHLIKEWHVDYGDGRAPIKVNVPHAWRQDVPVSWEGPAVYRTTIRVPDKNCWLVFEGVSYFCQVKIEGEIVAEHKGIWTAFSVPLSAVRGREVSLEVSVIKNGGPTFPVDEVASGFLPFVFNTFGGIYRDVWLVASETDPLSDVQPSLSRARVDGRKIFVDEKPFYVRGILTWGWYPETGHPNPPDVETEIEHLRKRGFNLIKFCLWAPSHHYLFEMERQGMFAWMELPIWDPSRDGSAQEQIFAEVREIVREYRIHSNIIFWTCGCELNAKVTADYKHRLYEMVKELTGSPLVKDNSGGSEMYGGDPREWGDFYDFHPYCDTHFYPSVLDSLLPGARNEMPLLLGEFNDCDLHRRLDILAKNPPYWAVADEFLNTQVRTPWARTSASSGRSSG